jgi:hypothetical protein
MDGRYTHMKMDLNCINAPETSTVHIGQISSLLPDLQIDIDHCFT